MKETLNIKNTSTLLSSLGLALLLLLSPCKVRNYIQAELGLPQTKVSSKSKTTLSNCYTYEVSENAWTSSKAFVETISALTVNSTVFKFQNIDFNLKSTFSPLGESSSLSVVPYYILFQNFRFHL